MIVDFGEDEVAAITDHFHCLLENGGVDPEQAELEWHRMRNEIYRRWVTVCTVKKLPDQ